MPFYKFQLIDRLMLSYHPYFQTRKVDIDAKTVEFQPVLLLNSADFKGLHPDAQGFKAPANCRDHLTFAKETGAHGP